MNRVWKGVWVVGIVMMLPVVGQAEEAAAPVLKEPPAEAPMPAVEPTAEQVHRVVREYISLIEEDEGSFTIEDEVTSAIRTLTLVQVQDGMTKTEDGLYMVHVDMKDSASSEAIGLEFNVEEFDGELEVVDTLIRTVNGQVRDAKAASAPKPSAP